MSLGTVAPVGAYPIKHHRICAERTRKDVSYPEDLRVEDPEGLLARFASGVAFEASTTEAMLAEFASAGWTVLTVRVDADTSGDHLSASDGAEWLGGRIPRSSPVCVNLILTDRGPAEHRHRLEALTRSAMDAGVQAIFGGRLVADGRVGEPDLLVRANPYQTRKHAFRYRAVDLKDHKSFEGFTRERDWQVSTLDAPFVESTSVLRTVGTPQLNDSLQLVHYWYLLRAVGRASDPVGGIIGREGVVVWRNLHDPLYERARRSAIDIYDEAFASYQEAVRHELARMSDPTIPPASTPEWKSACKECPWREACHGELHRSDHITLLPGITPRVAAGHYEVGISTRWDLANLDHRTARLVDSGVRTDLVIAIAATAPAETPLSALGLAPAELTALAAEGITTAADVTSLDARTALYAQVQVPNLGASIDQARVSAVQRVHRARGVEAVKLDRAAIELDVDIEDDGGGICYLIGVREARRSVHGVTAAFRPFVTWEHTPEAEAANFAAFWAYLQRRLETAKRSRIGSVRVFYYTDHESRYFRHLARTHAGTEGVPSLEEVEEFLSSDIWVDLHPIMSRQLVWPTEDHTLKSLAKYARHMWRDESPGGENSVAWYRTQLAADLNGDDALRDELRQRILAYNEDDVNATWALREFISKMGEARRPGLKLPGVETLDRKWGPRRPALPMRR